MLERHKVFSLPHSRLQPQKLSWQADRNACLTEETVLDPSHCPHTDSKVFQKLGTKQANILKQLKLKTGLSLNLDPRAIYEEFSVVREEQRVPQIILLQEKVFLCQHMREAASCKQG